MAHGKIIEQGSHEELLKRDGHYALLVAMDLQNEQVTTPEAATNGQGYNSLVPHS